MAARVAIYRMMRPGEPPTEDAVEALFNGLFFTEERYDLSAVGRMKFNRRVGREELTGASTLSNEDIVAVIRSWSSCATAAARSTTSTTSATAACARWANWPRTSSVPVWCASSAPSRSVSARPKSDNLMPHDLINAKPISAAMQGILRFVAAVAVHGPDQPAVGNHAQAPCLRTGPGRSDARTCRLRSARRAPDPLRPRVPDRNAGRPEHRPDQLAGAVCAHQRVRLHRNAVPQGGERAVSPTRSTTCPRSKKASSSSPRPMPTWTRRASFTDDTGVLRVSTTNSCWPTPDKHRVHGRGAGADRVGGGFADSVPRARRRQPRVDGRQHATPGGALPACRKSRWSVPASSAPWRSTPARRCRRCVAVVVDYVDAGRIVVRVNDDETTAGEVGVDIYNLIKYTRSNQNTNINQRPLVKVGDRDRPRRRGGRRRFDRHGRTGAGPEHAGRVHAVERLQLRGLDPDLRARGRRRPLHLDPHRRADGGGARHQARARKKSPATSPTCPKRSWRVWTSPASSTSAPKSRPATCWSARSRPRAKPS